MSEGGIAAVVVVRAAPPVELPTYTDELIGSMPLEEKKITLHERATVGARAAQRFQLRGKIDGVELRYSGLVVAGDGALVRVMAWQSAAMPCPSDRCFAPLFDAFSLLDGGPRAVAAAPAPPAADHGVGWRLKETAYESAISGLRVRPPPGWSLLLDANLERNNPAAEVGLVAPDAGLTLLFGSKLPLAPASGAPGAPRSLGAVAWAPAAVR